MYVKFIAVCLLLIASASAQVIGLSGNGSVGDVSGTIRLNKIEPKKPKPWLDTQTKIELGLALGAIASDGYTTCWNGGRGTRDYNPIIGNRNGSPVFDTVYFASSAASLVGGNYMLRKHPRIKHVLNWTVIGVESVWVYKNTSWHRR